MTALAIMALVYLYVSLAPDKGTLALRGGLGGATRAALGVKPRKSGGGRSRGGSSRKQSGFFGSLLAGWKEGVVAARRAREDGRDLWSRGSRAGVRVVRTGGRVAGGTRNLVGGIRTTIRDRRERRNQTAIPDADASPIDVPTAEPVPGNDDQVRAGLDQPGSPGGLADAFKPYEATEVWPENDEDREQDGALLFSSKTDDLGAAIGEGARPADKSGEADSVRSDLANEPVVPQAEEVTASEAAPTDDRYYVWTSPESGQFFVFDRMNLDDPQPAVDREGAELWAKFYNDRHGLATQNGEAARALAEIPKTSDASGAFDKNGNPWAFVMTDDYNRTCPKCGGQTQRVDDSFAADEKSSSWSNAYKCPSCGENARFSTPLTASEHSGLFGAPVDAAWASQLGLISAGHGPGSNTSWIPQTSTAGPAVDSTNHSSTTTRKDAPPMAIAGTELGNLDEVDGEAKAALTAIETLIEALNEIKGWGGNLPDRWSGTAWSTDGLDEAVAGVAEAAAELKIPEALMEQLTRISAEVKEARRVGEVAAEAGAKGDLSGFIPR